VRWAVLFVCLPIMALSPWFVTRSWLVHDHGPAGEHVHVVTSSAPSALHGAAHEQQHAEEGASRLGIDLGGDASDDSHGYAHDGDARARGPWDLGGFEGTWPPGSLVAVMGPAIHSQPSERVSAPHLEPLPCPLLPGQPCCDQSPRLSPSPPRRPAPATRPGGRSVLFGVLQSSHAILI